MSNDIKNNLLRRNYYRKRLWKLFLKKIAHKNWLLSSDTVTKQNQLSHDECEALWAKINFTLQTLN
ncbi:MAG: hypothetical protein RI981_1383 [Bacteroidota bacterium]|jgi:hypothetical protein